uniref:PA domain-containing protein n=1 Tax=Aplanochytrium stocchinoi TaxID=215587 RepID=A0A7S3LP66_9STRA
MNAGAKGIVIINREDSLLRNGSDGVLDPCDVDCELSQSSDRTTCESNSGCPSKFCLQTLEVDLDYCCLTEDLRNMPLIFDGSNLTTAEVLIPAAFVSVVDADAIISLLATSDANNETVLVSMSIRETNRWDASVWLLMLMGTLSTALASYRAARTERMQLSWIWGSSKRGQWDEVQVVTTTQNEQGEIENEETSQRRPENGVEVEDRELNNDSPPPPSPKTHRYDDSTLEQFELTTSQGLFLVVMAAASLVGLFFAVRLYPQQIVIAIIVLYGISAIYSTSYFVMSPLFRVILPNSIAYASIKIPMNRVTKECFLMDYVTVSSILGILSSLALVVVWFVLRHEASVWILQNLFSFTLAMMFLATLKIQRFQTAFWVLFAFCLYDIFMVFITPYFGNGESVMLEVATAGAGFEEASSDLTECNRVETERMPMLFLAPRFDYRGGFGLLGLGDVLLPGIFVTYVLRVDYLRADTWVWNVDRKAEEFPQPRKFDLRKYFRVHRYFFPVCIAYFLGLLVTFFANIFQWTINGVRGQPALLYLVPFTLTTFILLAKRNGELHLFWKHSLDELNPNNYIFKKDDDEENKEEQENEKEEEEPAEV